MGVVQVVSVDRLADERAVSLFGSGYGPVGPFAGALAARWGASVLLAAAMGLLGLCAALFSVSQAFERLLVLRALAGLLAGTVAPVGVTLIARTVATAKLPLAVGLCFHGFGLGALLPFGVFVPLLGPDDWRAHSRAAALIAVGAALYLWKVSRAYARGLATGPESAGPNLRDIRSALGSRNVQILALYTIPIVIPTLGLIPGRPFTCSSACTSARCRPGR